MTLGPVGEPLLAGVRQALGEGLRLAGQAGPALERPRYAFNEARGQHHAASIVRRLAALRPAGGAPPVLGLTDVDLFLPDADHVLGDADRGAGAALLSTARLASRDPARLLARARVEALHQAGHLLGLGHCLEPRCAMFLSRELAEVDRKRPALCPACRGALGLEG